MRDEWLRMVDDTVGGLVKALHYLEHLEELTGPRVAVFDADGVLWRGDVSEDFTRWMIERGHFDDALWDWYSRVNAADPAAACLAMLEFYTCMPVERLAAHVSEFWRTGGERAWIEPAVRTLRRLEAQGFSVYVVSGTPRPVLEPLVEHLPVRVDHILALELEVDADGQATGGHHGVVTCGTGKAQALRDRTAAPVYLAAGNSVLDVEILRLSDDVRWVIKPDAKLREVAVREGWLITDEDGIEDD